LRREFCAIGFEAESQKVSGALGFLSFALARDFARIVEQNENGVLVSGCARQTFCAWFRGPNPVERIS
jgi:hypothetical protein